MNGIHRLIVWTLVLHLSTQNNIPNPRYNNWLQTDDVANESSLTNEIHSKNIADNYEDASKLYIPEITEQCESLGICEDVPNYPEEHVKALVQEARWLDPTRFDTGFSDFEKVPQGGLKFKGDYEELCGSELKNITPRAAKNINNEWHFIVNTKERPSQTFTVEICKDPMTPCSNLVTFASNYRGWCQQKYILRKMTAINKHGELIEAPYQLCSCCSCVYKYKDYIKK